MIPPDVVDVDRDFEVGCVDFGTKVIGSLEGGNGATVSAVAGVKGFDEEFDVELGSLFYDGSDAITDLVAVGEG